MPLSPPPIVDWRAYRRGIIGRAGASAYFLGGAVVYTELARAALLRISDA